jgi:succinyl-diaminopimelate desuccinylase
MKVESLMDPMEGRIDSFISANRKAMLSDVAKLVSIRSVRGKAAYSMPYGPAVAAALDCAAGMAAGHGLAAKNVDGYILEIDLNDLPDRLGILCHLDVVPEGAGWSTPPFEMDTRDGKIYGRGVADNKGPAVAAIYALKCVKELGVPLSGNVRLMLGTDEEHGSSDLKAYRERREMPPCCFSPDAAFPVYNIEKGRYASTFGASWEKSEGLPHILSAEGGSAVNVVPDTAEAVVAGLNADEASETASAVTEATGVNFETTDVPGGVRIKAAGVGTHASFPEYGKNAVTAMIELLGRLPLHPSEGLDRLRTLNALVPHGDFSGKALGVAMSDSLSGPLTFNLGIFSMDEEGMSASFDARCPLCSNDENTTDVIAGRLRENGFETGDDRMSPPHHVSEELPFVKTLLKAYEETTGLKGECLAMGGGTYVHGIENCVAFGAAYPETETYAHAADEYTVIEELEANVKIYVKVILDFCA